MTIFCSKCGTELEADASFCEECGNPIGTAGPPEPEATQSDTPGPEASPIPPVMAAAAPPLPTAPVTPGSARFAPGQSPGGFQPAASTPASPGGYASPSANPFTQFSGEMNRNTPSARTRGPGKLLGMIIMAAIVVAVGIGVFLLGRAMQVDLEVMSGTWSTVIVTATGERQPGTMTLTLNHRGEGTATFTGHSELAQPLQAVYKNGKLTLTGPNISMSGKAEEVRGVTDVEGTFKIGGRKGEWAAILQP